MTKTYNLNTAVPLADYLKDGTWSLHTKAEKTGVVAEIIGRRVSLRDYSNFIQNLAEIYKVLENQNSWMSDFVPLQECFTDSLYRYKHLENDYKNLLSLNASIKKTLVVHDVTEQYCEHIAHAQSHSPLAMLGHIYVRYLGDLNGGQVLHKLLKSALDLSDECLSFYAFPEISNIHEFRLRFRSALNSVLLTDEEKRIATRGAIDAFNFNIALSKACNTQQAV